MTERNQTQPLVATLRDALHTMAAALGRTQADVGAIGAEAGRLREGLARLGALRRREETPVGLDLVIDAVTDLLQAVQDLDMALSDAQRDVETLEAAREDEDGGDV